MRLPFGLDLKSIVLTVVFMMFVWPWIMGFIARQRRATNE